jgi:hypothetical protein
MRFCSSEVQFTQKAYRIMDFTERIRYCLRRCHAVMQSCSLNCLKGIGYLEMQLTNAIADLLN